jgi:hypothetical protein
LFVQTGWLKLNTSDWQWPEARAACEEDGGHLAVPATTQDLGVFKEILKENADVLKRTVLKNQVFIGVFYPEGSRKLTTVMGTVCCVHSLRQLNSPDFLLACHNYCPRTKRSPLGSGKGEGLILLRTRTLPIPIRMVLQGWTNIL